MAIPKNINNLKDIEIYTYNENEKGNIEINFNIKDPGDHKLEISNDTLKSMMLTSVISKELNKIGSKKNE